MALAFAAACGGGDDDNDSTSEPRRAESSAPAETSAPAESSAAESAPAESSAEESTAEASSEELGGRRVERRGAGRHGPAGGQRTWACRGRRSPSTVPEVADEADGFQASFAPLEERTGVKVEYAGSRDFETQISVAIESGQTPDIAFFPQPGKVLDAHGQDRPGVPDDVKATVGEELRPVLVRARHRPPTAGPRRPEQGRPQEPRLVQPEGVRGERLDGPHDVGRVHRSGGHAGRGQDAVVHRRRVR